ncbi:WD40-repeat-containing domain protein [Lipomyces oligophaga]|uniref:WD40-repeat-containing domain protein n=1 Tax=Lipomyces oligophaga TaxID=45792 RepID=UPI0034CE7319
MPLKQIQSIPVHVDRIWSLAPNPSLPLLAVATSDKAAQVFSLNTYFPIAVLDGQHSRSVRSVAWKPRLPRSSSSDIVLATASFDGTVGVWIRDADRYAQKIAGDGNEDSDDGSDVQLEEWEFVAQLEGHENEVKCVDWSADGSYLASCSRDKSVWIWEADEDNEEFECIAVLQDHTQDVKHVVWHPTENLLASASYDDTIRLWREDDDDWVCSSEIIGHRSTVWCIDFDKQPPPVSETFEPDSPKPLPARMVSCSADETVRVWSRTSLTGASGAEDGDMRIPSTFRSDPVSEVWTQEATLPSPHSGPIYSVSWSPYSGRIVSVGADGFLVVYEEIKTGSWEVIAFEEDAHSVFEINAVAWSRKWKPERTLVPRENPSEKDSLVEEIIITGGDDGNINIWEVVPN